MGGGKGGTVKLAISLHCTPGLTHSKWAIPWDVLCTWVLDGGGHQAAFGMHGSAARFGECGAGSQRQQTAEPATL